MSWTVSRVPHDRFTSLIVRQGGRRARWTDLIQGWRDDPTCRTAWTAALVGAEAAAVHWECAPLSMASLDNPVGTVILDAPRLAQVIPDRRTFAHAFTDPSTPIATFPNLGGDALLAVPRTDATPAPHLLAFLRHAPAQTTHALWRATAEAIMSRLAHRAPAPVWVSTAGMGVSWLHIRLDNRPKYYRHGPFRHA